MNIVSIIMILTFINILVSLLSLGIGLKIYSKIPYIGLLVLVIEPMITFAASGGILLGIIERSELFYQLIATTIVVLKGIGLYYIYKAIAKVM